MVMRLFSMPLIAFTMMLSACGETKYADVSTQPGYREMVGVTYTIVGPVSAYGIRKHSKAAMEFVSVIPPPGIDGPEVGFRIPIMLGATLTVVSVYKTNRVFDPDISLGVKLNEVDIPANLPIRVDLMRGNQGADKLSLNPAMFRRN